MLAFMFGVVMLVVTAIIYLGNYGIRDYHLHLLVACIMCGLGGLMW